MRTHRIASCVRPHADKQASAGKSPAIEAKTNPSIDAMAAVTMAACAAAAVLALASSSSCDDDERSNDGATAAVEASSSPPAASPECAVCLSELSAGGGVGGISDADEANETAAVRTLAECGHGFHAECIGRWLLLRPECPLCRRPVLLEDDGVARDWPDASRSRAASAAPATAWARPTRIECGFGDGRVVWTRSPSVRQ